MPIIRGLLGLGWEGFYLEAYLRIYKRSAISFVERQLISYEDQMTCHCIGSIPELFDGNPPFGQRGHFICHECGRNFTYFEFVGEI